MISDQELETKVDKLFDKLTPDLSGQILKDIDAAQKPAVRKRNLKNLWLRIGSMAAVFVLLAVGAFSYAGYAKIDSTVTLDVNPSIELCVNRSNRVLRVTPLNEDGETVIGTMNLKNVDLDVAVNALIGSMMKNGYLSEISNSILITVDGSDELRSWELSAHVSAEVDSMLKAGFPGAVLSQTATNDEMIRYLADSNSITVGKAQLIQTLIGKNPMYTFEELSKLTINELNVLLEKQPMTETIRTIGNASTEAYIGEEQALANACLYVGLEASEVELTEPVELEFENGRMVYDIEFRKDDVKYEFEVDAVSGEVVSFEEKQKSKGTVTEPQVTPVPTAVDIGQERALEIALAHANVPGSEAMVKEIKKKHENGVEYYEIEFFDDEFEYDYKVNSATGAIMKAEKERDDDAVPEKAGTSSQNTETIGKEKAKEIALRHAGISASAAKKLKCELDRENGKLIYEVEFKTDGYEFEYTIDAGTGKILHVEKERDD
ncbi:MAG: PepSY domain-containing protein [Clostridia bacterium]|nr:PepSY domain-containing protein [Clostridia bacterium]